MNLQEYTIENFKVSKNGELLNHSQTCEWLAEILKDENKKQYDKIGYKNLTKIRNASLNYGEIFNNLEFLSKLSKGISMSIIDMKDSNFDFDVIVETDKGFKYLQRGLVWTDEQKQNLIKTILNDEKVPNLSVYVVRKNGERFYEIIDGKQRLTTFLAFYDNKFPLVVNGSKYFYDDLDVLSKMQINSYSFYFDMFYEQHGQDAKLADAMKIAWFKKINTTGTPQDLEHLKQF